MPQVSSHNQDNNQNNNSVPSKLRPYTFHGIRLVPNGAQYAKGDCPFCGKGGKFSVEIATGLAKCWGCTLNEKSARGGVNASSFLQLLWDRSDEATNDYEELSAERGLLRPETLMHWGVCRSVINGNWLIPGYSPDGKLAQLYQRIKFVKRWELRPTPTITHRIHGLPLFHKDRPWVYVCESWGNAMALWEIMSMVKLDMTGHLIQTGSIEASLLSEVNVISVANCGGVGEALRPYLPLFKGKKVVMTFDNDHPRTSPDGKEVEGAGLAASRRMAKLLAGTASEIHYLAWGNNNEFWNGELKSGYDVRDVLTQTSANTPEGRSRRLEELLEEIKPVPETWTGLVTRPAKVNPDGRAELEPMECRSWEVLENAWMRPMSWRQSMSDVLSVMLAVALSTEQSGDQLFLQVIGSAGSAKTRFCDAMLVSKTCFALEHLTGFHSGWKPKGSDEDYSMITRINRKTLITPEGDVLMSNPKFKEIMSQQRRIFDGSSGASYKNRNEDLKYTGLRTPWIIAGTPALLDIDQARLGDRFLVIFVDQPSHDERRNILQRVGFTAINETRQRSNCDPSSVIEERLLNAYRLTGGYVDYLRANAEELLSAIDLDEEELVSRCSMLGEFTAYMRSRPHPDHKRDSQASKELPTRLTKQLVRMAMCLTAVMCKEKVDNEVYRRLWKIAMDTSNGIVLNTTRALYDAPDGKTDIGLGTATGRGQERERTLLRFLREVGAVVPKKDEGKQIRWMLTPDIRNIMDGVLGARATWARPGS